MLAPTLAASRAYGGALPRERKRGALRLQTGGAGSAAPAGEDGALYIASRLREVLADCGWRA